MSNFKKNLAALGPKGWAVLAAIAAFAFFISFVVVPMISQSTGIADETVSFMGALVSFAIAIGCFIALKIVNKNRQEKK